MPQWPAALAQCPIIGWSETVSSNVVEFDPDAGFPRRRRRSTVRTYRLQCAYKLSKADLATFWSFYEDDIIDGVLPFDWPNPRNNAVLSSVTLAGEPQVVQVTNNVYTLDLTVTVVE